MCRSGRVGSKPAFTLRGLPVFADSFRRSSSSARTCTSTAPRVMIPSCSSTGGNMPPRIYTTLTGSVVLVGAARDLRSESAVVHELFELLADLEERKTLRRDRNRPTGPRVATRVGLVGTDGEAAEPTD